MVLTASKKGVFTVSSCDVETGVDNVPKLVREEVGLLLEGTLCDRSAIEI